MLQSTLIHAIISVCMSLKSGDVLVAGAMTGRSVRTPIPERKLAVVIRGSIITPERRVLISGKVVVRKAMRVSFLTAFLSVGFIRRVTGLSRVKTAVTVAVVFVSSLIRRIRLEFCRIKAPTESIRSTVCLRCVERFSFRFLRRQVRRR
jgi:hypothetical protein